MASSFGMLNLVVGVIVEMVLSQSRQSDEKQKQKQEQDRARNLDHLREVFEMSDEDGNGTLELEELQHALQRPDVLKKLRLIDLPISDAEDLFHVLDANNSGSM